MADLARHCSKKELNERTFVRMVASNGAWRAENIIAHQLAERAQLFSEGLGVLTHHGCFSPTSNGEDAGGLLRDQCQEMRDQINQIKAECSRLPEIPCLEDKESSLHLHLELHRLRAELAVWQKQKADVLSSSDAVIEADVHQQLRENLEQLQPTLATIRGQKILARKKLEREQQLLRESHQVRDALRRKLSALEEGQTTTPTGNPEAEVERKLEGVKDECTKLKESLEKFVNEYILQPSEVEEEEEESVSRRTRRGTRQSTLDSMLRRQRGSDEGQQLPNLVAVIQSLIDKCLDTPHDPYLPASSIWQPHFHLLLRSGVLQRHPDNPALVRITPFHY